MGLSFNVEVATKLNKFGVIPILADILSDAQKEKVSRIILAVFRNLIEKPEELEVKKENCISMVQCKVLKQLELLEQRKFDDEDIQKDQLRMQGNEDLNGAQCTDQRNSGERMLII